MQLKITSRWAGPGVAIQNASGGWPQAVCGCSRPGHAV